MFNSNKELEQAPTSSKRHKPNDAALSIENICKTCNTPMKKKEIFIAQMVLLFNAVAKIIKLQILHVQK
ncbi:hypothetical protein BpHYR1_042748 [Brachionus plicatilis]|uniref:Uncharacterized protein n=1 Tax=Brachionus plicatilis TaxID=10195 RepID=A0A3M7PS98_BRAPC|nr:hypothetical protein BpHYR1_042748 [Brachionus plicatilis]